MNGENARASARPYRLAALDERGNTAYCNMALRETGHFADGITRPKVVCGSDGRNGFLKDSRLVDDSDDMEIVINFIGRCLGVRMAEEYRVLDENGQGIALFSANAAQKSGERFQTLRQVQFAVWRQTCRGQLSLQAWMKHWLAITKHPAFPDIPENAEYRCDSMEDACEAVRLPARLICARYPNCLCVARSFQREYLRMILLDLLTGQTDRTMDNYGVLENTAGDLLSMAPLFDNATLAKPNLTEEQYSLNGMVMRKDWLCAALSIVYGKKLSTAAGKVTRRYLFHKKKIEEAAEQWLSDWARELLFQHLERGFERLSAISR